MNYNSPAQFVIAHELTPTRVVIGDVWVAYFSDMRLWILIVGLFSLSLFLQIVGHIKSTDCVWHLRNNCADFGFAESASGIVTGILAVVLLTVKLLMRLKNTSARSM